MRKTFLLLAAICCTVINSLADNVITYRADQKLPEVTGNYNTGLHTNAFNANILAHTFSNGTGTIVFSDKLTTIGENAFYNCPNVLSLTIPNSVTSIGRYAFDRVCNVEYNGTANVSDSGARCLNGYVENNLVYSDATKTKLCGCPSFVSGAMVIPNTVTTIGMNAFVACKGITSVTIPNSVTTIGIQAFDGMSNITELTIPASVTSIGWDAFRDWSKSLTSIRVEEGNANYDSRNNCNALIETATNTLVLGCANTVIPNTITVIGDYAFSECKNLPSITIPTGVTRIEGSAFIRCNLTEVILPSSLTQIGSQAFFYCNQLTKIICLATTPPACYGGSYPSFQGLDKSTPVYVPSGSIAAYKSAEEWKEFTSIKAYTKNYAVAIKGAWVTADNSADILNDGTVSYDEISNTLTLNNADITDNYDIVATWQDLTIQCIGNNTLYANGSSNNGIYADGGKVTITGPGSLLVKSSGHSAIDTQNDLTIQGGCTVTAQSEYFFALSIAGGMLTVDNATLIAKGNNKYATINGCNNLVLKDAEITSAHTYDVTKHRFLNAAGESAMDDIIISGKSTALLPVFKADSQTPNKFIHNGQLLIERNGKVYNAAGMLMK